MMKGSLVFLVITAAIVAGGYCMPGLRVRFDVGIDFGGTFFFDIPKSIGVAIDLNWTFTSRPSGPLPELLMYCFTDKVLCALFDDTGYITGLQIAIAESVFTENVFDWEKRGFTSWYTTIDGQTKRFWTLLQYFVNEEFLAKSKEERLASRDTETLLQAGAVWVTGIDNILEKISTQEDDIVNETLFTKQACMDWMGQHFYYNMSTSTECVASQMYPWFLLASKGKLVGTGLITYGKLEIREGQRNWFERPRPAIAKAIVPNSPECLHETVDNPGAVTMHIYYIEQPWTIQC